MKQKDILFILISSCILTILWVGFSLYNAAVTSTISETLQLQITPIDPLFDTAAINDLRTRTAIQPNYTFQGVPASVTPSPQANNSNTNLLNTSLDEITTVQDQNSGIDNASQSGTGVSLIGE